MWWVKNKQTNAYHTLTPMDGENWVDRGAIGPKGPHMPSYYGGVTAASFTIGTPEKPSHRRFDERYESSTAMGHAGQQHGRDPDRHQKRGAGERWKSVRDEMVANGASHHAGS